MGLEKDRGYDKAKSLRGNCCQLRKYQSANYPEVISVVNHLYNEMIDAYGLKLSRESSIKKLKHHIQFFVLNLYKAYCNNSERVIAYSRDHSDYSGKKSRYKNKFGLSFRYSLDNGKEGKPVICFLEKQGYIVNFRGYYDERNPEKTFSSRMRATGKLIHLIVKMYQISEGMIEHDTSDDELIVVKGIKPKPKWITFEKNGKTIRKKIKGKRKVCKTPDTPAVRGMRKNLEIINAVMEKADITLDISDAELMQLNVRMLDDPGTYKEAIDFSRKHLHRVFLDRRLDRGGRFYGPWYQNIPKEYRQYIMINSAPTMELDYSSLHPTLLYWYAHVDPPEGDLYELEGYSKETRKFIKGIFLRMINSSSRLEAKGSIRKAVFYVSKKEKKLKKRMKIPAELGRLQDKYLDPVIDKLLEKHKALQKFIFRVKDLGNILQYVDSMIAENVLLNFAMDGIPVLPLHDSFRADARISDNVRQLMQRIIVESFGIPIRISNKDFVPLIGRLFGMVEDQIKRDEIRDEEELKSIISDLEGSIIFTGVAEKLKSLMDEYKAKKTYL